MSSVHGLEHIYYVAIFAAMIIVGVPITTVTVALISRGKKGSVNNIFFSSGLKSHGPFAMTSH
jgi:hypothetical protein